MNGCCGDSAPLTIVSDEIIPFKKMISWMQIPLNTAVFDLKNIKKLSYFLKMGGGENNNAI